MSRFKESDRKYRTKEGERVYSLGELSIANYLADHDILYNYEPIRYIDRRKWVPDFYLCNEDVYIEYLGMKGDKEYDQNTKVKMGYYHSADFKVIYIYPSELGRLDNALKFKFKRETGKKLNF